MPGYGLAAGEPAQTDEAARWLHLAQSGDAAAFEALLRIHEIRVARTALRLLANRQDAQDAAQEVFLRLHRNLRQIDCAGNLSGWLYRVTVNVCRDMLRRRKNVDSLDDSRLSVESSAEADMEHEQQRRMVVEAVGSLPERERAALTIARPGGAFDPGSCRDPGLLGGDGAVANLGGAVEDQEDAAESIMNCQAFEPMLALYVEGDLPQRDMPRVEEHVATCADCRDLLEDLRSSQAALKKLGAEAVDGALLTAVRSGVLSRIDNPRKVVWPWVAAATAALALPAMLLAPSRPPAPEPRPVAIAQAPPKIEAAVGGASPPARSRRTRRRSVTGRPPAPQQLVVKMLTDDPDIVIIWLVDQTGD